MREAEQAVRMIVTHVAVDVAGTSDRTDGAKFDGVFGRQLPYALQPCLDRRVTEHQVRDWRQLGAERFQAIRQFFRHGWRNVEEDTARANEATAVSIAAEYHQAVETLAPHPAKVGRSRL